MATAVQQGQAQPLQFIRVKISGTDPYKATLFQALSQYPYLVFRSGNILVNGDHLSEALAQVEEANSGNLLGNVEANGLAPESGIVLPGGAPSSFFREVVSTTGSIALFLAQTTGMMFFALNLEDGTIRYTLATVTNPPSMPPLDVLARGKAAPNARHGLLDVLTEHFHPSNAPANGLLQA